MTSVMIIKISCKNVNICEKPMSLTKQKTSARHQQLIIKNFAMELSVVRKFPVTSDAGACRKQILGQKIFASK